MDLLFQILGLLLMLVTFASGAFLFGVQPIWAIIDAAVSPRLSNGAKVAIILLAILLLGPVLTIIYALTQRGALRKATVVAGIFLLASVSGVLTLAALSPQETDLGGIQQAGVSDADAGAHVTYSPAPTPTNPDHDPAPPPAGAP